MPDVLEPWAQAGTLTRAAADALGLAAGTPVAVGTGDNMAAALGIGIRPGEVAVSIGTSGTVFTRSTRPVQDPTGSVAGFADATGHYLPLVCTLNAALVTDAVARLLTVGHDDLDDLALHAPPGSDGLVLVPYLAGERTPNRPSATGSLLGIRPGIDRCGLARAAFEGVVCGLLDGLDALIDAGAPVERDRLVLVGGGSRSSAYRGVLASLSGQAVTVPRHGQPVSTGAAVQAAVLASGSDVDDVTDAWGLRHGTLTEPSDDPSLSAEVRERFRHARGLTAGCCRPRPHLRTSCLGPRENSVTWTEEPRSGRPTSTGQGVDLDRHLPSCARGPLHLRSLDGRQPRAGPVRRGHQTDAATPSKPSSGLPTRRLRGEPARQRPGPVRGLDGRSGRPS